MYKSLQLSNIVFEGLSKQGVVQWLKIPVLIFLPGNSWLACCWPAVCPGSSQPTSMRWCKGKVSGGGECLISGFSLWGTYYLSKGKGTAQPLNYLILVALAHVSKPHFCVAREEMWNRYYGKCINALFSLLPYFKSLLMVSHSCVLISLLVFQERRNMRPDLKRNCSNPWKTSKEC